MTGVQTCALPISYTNEYAPYYSISYDGKSFSIADFRANHPVVGVMWSGTIHFCNWLSKKNGLVQCYDLVTSYCDFNKNGYRLPTEAEWEYAGRGGNDNPYFKYPWGNQQDNTKANWPESKDPYEGINENSYPFTTPVGFYDGNLKQKSEFDWNSAMPSFQTSNGANNYGLHDMAGNVWEFLNDWYGQKYYEESPYDNPKGPDSGFIMPDGKPYRGMRSGNWYNGYKFTGDTVNDGHSRVANRNPSYYRGPQDPNHPWYHVGFRVVRKYDSTNTSNIDNKLNSQQDRIVIHPNPASESISISNIDDSILGIIIYNTLGIIIKQIGSNSGDKVNISTAEFDNGIYFISILKAGNISKTYKILIIK